MPDLVPVEGNPFGVTLEPVEHNPSWADSLQGNFGAASQQLLAQEAQRRGVVGNVLQHFTLPGRVAQGVQPQTPGVMTEADAYRINQLNDEAHNWAPAQAMNSIGSGMPMAEKMALGAGGGAIKAYHGSPYDFEKFDINKIGSGEGAQAYGHGLYFAENPAVAEEYKKSLTVQQLQDFYDQLAKTGRAPRPAPPEGKMYEVNINADPEHFLDYDKPLHQQSEHVQQAIKKAGLAPQEQDLGSFAGMPVGGASRWADTPEQMHALREAGIPGIKYLDQGSRGDQYFVRTNPPNTHIPTNLHPLDPRNLWTPAATPTTKPYGVVGPGNITHAEFGTREEANAFVKQKNAEDQTHNYVVFHHDIVDILKKYGLAGLVAGGAAHFKTTPVQHDPFAAQQ